jgi:hypothetical protein
MYAVHICATQNRVKFNFSHIHLPFLMCGLVGLFQTV